MNTTAIVWPVYAVSALQMFLAVPVMAQASCTDLDSLAWMEGEWVAETGPDIIQETWARVSPDTMEGQGVVRRAETGERAFGESLRVVVMSGEVFYLAKVPDNELPVAFRAVSCGDGHAVFENMAHDFPKRLEYRLVDGRLKVRVSDGADRSFNLDFTRRSEAPGSIRR